jgi:hypothetical protein
VELPFDPNRIGSSDLKGIEDFIAQTPGIDPEITEIFGRCEADAKNAEASVPHKLGVKREVDQRGLRVVE